MSRVSRNFTFTDDSTLSSFTAVREHPIVETRPRTSCAPDDDEDDDGESAIAVDGEDNGTMADESVDYDCRTDVEDVEEEDDKENASFAGRESAVSKSVSKSSSRSSRSSKQHNHSSTFLTGGGSSSKASSRSQTDAGEGCDDAEFNGRFWATLSAHAAAAAMSSGYNNKKKQAAASAAAESLLEDGQDMERINASRAKSMRKAPMKITQQTVRNAASKASIAVLRSGCDVPEVAAAVAGAVLAEGGRLLNERSGNGTVSSSGSKRTGPPSQADVKATNSNGSSRTSSRKSGGGKSRGSKAVTSAGTGRSKSSGRGGEVSGSRTSSRASSTGSPPRVKEVQVSSRRSASSAAASRSLPPPPAKASSVAENSESSTISTATSHGGSVQASHLTAHRGSGSRIEPPSVGTGFSVSSSVGGSASIVSLDEHRYPQRSLQEESREEEEESLNDEEKELERKQANLIAAMETLQQKLDELDSHTEKSVSASAASPYHSEGGATMVRHGNSNSPTTAAQARSFPRGGVVVRGGGGRNDPREQLRQLSMVANPTMATHGSASSLTHYPPMPAVDTIMTVDSEHHGYSNGSPNSSIGIAQDACNASVASDAASAAASIHKHGRYSFPASTISSQQSIGSRSSLSSASSASSSARATSSRLPSQVPPTSSTSVRSVLKKPSKCFPIVEGRPDNGACCDGDCSASVGGRNDDGYYYDRHDADIEAEPTWDEDGTVFLSVGECRIQAKKDEATQCPSTTAAVANPANPRDQEDVAGAEEAIEVVLVPDTDPKSSFKNRVKGFFKRKSKRVTFVDNELKDADSPQTQVATPGNGTGDVTTNAAQALPPPADSSAPANRLGKNANRLRRRRSRRLRQKLMNKFRFILDLKRKSKPPTNAAQTQSDESKLDCSPGTNLCCFTGADANVSTTALLPDEDNAAHQAKTTAQLQQPKSSLMHSYSDTTVKSVTELRSLSEASFAAGTSRSFKSAKSAGQSLGSRGGSRASNEEESITVVTNYDGQSAMSKNCNSALSDNDDGGETEDDENDTMSNHYSTAHSLVTYNSSEVLQEDDTWVETVLGHNLPGITRLGRFMASKPKEHDDGEEDDDDEDDESEVNDGMEGNESCANSSGRANNSLAGYNFV